jgi:hypothetical protein
MIFYNIILAKTHYTPYNIISSSAETQSYQERKP